jgi:ASC-1-like (ASCH) protein
MDYYKKYIKYKTKYQTLLNQKAGNETRLHISEPWFSFIRDGHKKVEGRPNKILFQNMQIGSILVIYNNKLNEEYRVKIIDKKKYSTFYDMLEKEGINNVLPGVNTIEKGVEIYRQWYDEKIETEYGVIGLHMEVMQ